MRLFIGVPLPGEYARIIREIQDAWKERLASKVSWMRPEIVHVTLKFLGTADEDKVPAIVRAMRVVKGKPFSMQGGHGGCFPVKGAPRVIWVGLRQGGQECTAYFNRLDGELAQAGFSVETKTFTPHLTLARVKTAIRGDDWPGLIVDLRRDWPAFTVDRIVLWRSMTKPSGPEYRRLVEVELEQ